MKHLNSLILLSIFCCANASEMPTQKLFQATVQKAAHGQYGFSIPDDIVVPLAGHKEETLCCISTKGHYCLYDVYKDEIVDFDQIPLDEGYSLADACPVSAGQLLLGLKKERPSLNDGLLNIFDLEFKKITTKQRLGAMALNGVGRQRGTWAPVACNVAGLVPLTSGEILVDYDKRGYCGQYNAQGVRIEPLLIAGKKKIFTAFSTNAGSYLACAKVPDNPKQESGILSIRHLEELQKEAYTITHRYLSKNPNDYHVSTTHEGDVIISPKEEGAVAVFSMSDACDDAQIYENNRYKKFGKLHAMPDGTYRSFANGLVHTWKDQARAEEGKEEDEEECSV